MQHLSRSICLALVASMFFMAMPGGAPAATSTVAWTSVFGPRNDSTVAGAACDGAGNVYVVGTVNGKLPGQVKRGSTDVFVRKYSRAGKVLWTRQYGGLKGWNLGLRIAVDKDGRSYVGGQWSTNGGNFRAFLRACSAAGAVRWTRFWTADNGARAVALSSAGGSVYVASNRDDVDIIVRRYSSMGVLRKQARVPTAGRSPTGDLSVDPSGNVYVCGTADRGNAGGYCYLRKTSPNLATRWTRTWAQWDGQGYSDVVADAGGAWLAGWVDSAPDTTTPYHSVYNRYSAAGSLLVSRSSTDTEPTGLAKDAYALYVVDAVATVDGTASAEHWAIHKFDKGWTQVDSWTAGPVGKMNWPEGCATDRFRNLVVVGAHDYRPAVVKYKK